MGHRPLKEARQAEARRFVGTARERHHPRRLAVRIFGGVLPEILARRHHAGTGNRPRYRDGWIETPMIGRFDPC